MKATMQGIDKVYDRTEAILNEQAFYAAFDAGCVRYVRDEVVRILNLSDDEYYIRVVPSYNALGCLWCGREVWEITMANEYDREGPRQHKE